MIDGYLKEFYEACKAAATRAGRTYAGLENGEEQPASIKIENGVARVRIQGVLDGGIFGPSAAAIIEALDDGEFGELELLIDSPGGLAYQGRTLYQDFRARASDGVAIRAENRGLVASAAVLPFLAADERTVPEGTEIMVHRPWGAYLLVGNADEIRSRADKIGGQLDSMETSYETIVASRSALGRSAASRAIRAETWYSADEASEAGFARKKGDPAPKAGTLNDNIHARTRQVLAARLLG